MHQNIPVVMYHSVGLPKKDWMWDFLTIPYGLFEDHIRCLRSKGFVPIDFKEYYAHVRFGAELPERCVFLHFDDGYLDNWVFAYPILRKYGFKGTIFVNPEFVDPALDPRPNLDDVWKGRAEIEDLTPHGFLSWAEMRAMEQEGVMDIQSHAMTHTWYFSGPEIVDFRHPGDSYVWMDWNENPEEKWAYLSADPASRPSRMGSPVYAHGKSLEVRRFFPDERLSRHLEAHVESRGPTFFDRPDWKSELHALAGEFRSTNRLHESTESEEEYIRRMHWELGESKRILESRLSKEVDLLCWPGGGYDSGAVEISKQYYLATTLASRERKRGVPLMDGDHVRVERIGCPHVVRKGRVEYTNGRYLYHFMREYQGSGSSRLVRKFLKLFKLIWGIG
ncbi:polysaccharide deacetylase family protein [Desulfomicrobium sp. ZS1]|uniref:polysaccharide deacetylase family protein n=1 Tax=Desulfomicrobium sp. ZS1 TaxID=2952228 RepID=UPI0020B22CEF|nr:polysaccharide deacetylase family protein [Desulfomicrobium sp. ZS1]UTF50715.1 polysaccharide deacetylase family protein [Desulfomicrobium sp. ZS1]